MGLMVVVLEVVVKVVIDEVLRVLVVHVFISQRGKYNDASRQ